MNDQHRDFSGERDPLGLSALEDPRPADGSMEADWAVVSAGLSRRRRQRTAWAGGLAVAASIALVITLTALPRPDGAPLSQPGGGLEIVSDTPTASDAQASSAQEAGPPDTARLMAMSQDMEQQLAFLRGQVGSMPSEVVAYQVELQDLIGQVDDALNLAPDSTALWGQRLGLQVELVRLYRGQLRRDYSHFASL